jgi:predicted metal-dependent phosphoesterase TrpH
VPVDLHTHSNASDGTDEPADVIRAAAAAELSAVALTDHDNLDGIAEASLAAAETGIELVAGTELSVDWPGGAMHMLVYFLEPGPGPLQDRLKAIQDGREDRNRRVVIALNDLGIDITYDEVATEAGGKGIGRPHLAAVLIRKGVVPDMQAAFDEYLATGRPAYQERLRLDHAEAARLAVESGAVPVVAHPHTIGASVDDYQQAFGRLAEAGVLGVECYYPEYEPELRQHLVELTRSVSLVPTGGSDYHGTYKPGIDIGSGRGDLEVADEVLEEVRGLRR